jgi:hypothetical protein
MISKILSRHDRVKYALAKEIKGCVEQKCKYGLIDILTNYESIEVKKTSYWKQALGQALVYAEATNTLPRVHLYGKDRLSKDQENVIMRLGVRLSYDIKKD